MDEICYVVEHVQGHYAVYDPMDGNSYSKIIGAFRKYEDAKQFVEDDAKKGELSDLEFTWASDEEYTTGDIEDTHCTYWHDYYIHRLALR